MFATILFFIFSAVLVCAALGVILARNPVHCALLLVLCFFNSAVIWLMLDAEFLGIVLVLVYVGAVMVLFLFVVMMLDIDTAQLRSEFASYWPLAVAVAGFVVFAIINVARGAAPRRCGPAPRAAAPCGLFEHAHARHCPLHPLRLPRPDRRRHPAGREYCGHHPHVARPKRREASGHRSAGGGARPGPRADRQDALRENPHDQPDLRRRPLRHPVRDRGGWRVPEPQERDHPADVHRADAARRELQFRRVLALHGRHPRARYSCSSS